MSPIKVLKPKNDFKLEIKIEEIKKKKQKNEKEKSNDSILKITYNVLDNSIF